MKLLISILVLLGINLSSASAKDVQWLGYLCLVNKLNDICVADGIQQGECLGLRLVLRNYPSTIRGASFSLFHEHWAENYTIAKGNVLDGKFRDAAGTGIGPDVWTFPAKLRISDFKPNPIPNGGNYIYIKGDIYDYDGAKGCNVQYRAAVARRPPY